MARRSQFQGICHDVLDTFLSRYNDLDGYWAVGQYRSFLEDRNQAQIEFRLPDGITLPENAAFGISSRFYWATISRMMKSHEMPQGWIADALITLSIVSAKEIHCEIEILSDLGRTYRSSRSLNARPHDPSRERRRTDSFGLSTQKQR